MKKQKLTRKQEKFVKEFTGLALTRGIGWAVLWYDTEDKKILASWVDEQHLGQLNGCHMILAIDMWEHAFMTDYGIKKADYIAAFMNAINWEIVEKRI